MSWVKLLEEKSALVHALDLVGDHWTLLIITACFNGHNRFNQLERRLGINRNLLKARLDRLVGAGLLKKQKYGESENRFEYIATPIGWKLRPAIISLVVWGEECLTKEDTPISNVHKLCGGDVRTQIHCDVCNEGIGYHDIELRLNSGAGAISTKVVRDSQEN